jgi:hypothetical protein
LSRLKEDNEFRYDTFLLLIIKMRDGHHSPFTFYDWAGEQGLEEINIITRAWSNFNSSSVELLLVAVYIMPSGAMLSFLPFQSSSASFSFYV